MADPVLLILGVASLLFLIIVYFVWRSATGKEWITTSRKEKEEWKRLAAEKAAKEKEIEKKKAIRKARKR